MHKIQFNALSLKKLFTILHAPNLLLAIIAILSTVDFLIKNIAKYRWVLLPKLFLLFPNKCNPLRDFVVYSKPELYIRYLLPYYTVVKIGIVDL